MCCAVSGCLGWLLFSAPVQAQTVVDGSAQKLLPGQLPFLLSVLERGLTRSDGRGDAETARVRGIVEARPGVYCGQVSTQGRNGEYGRFTQFVVETKIRNATVAPVDDPGREAMMLAMIKARCRSGDGARE
jgi:hypothetical protein